MKFNWKSFVIEVIKAILAALVGAGGAVAYMG